MNARWAPWLFLLICAILPFATTLLSGKVLGPTEHIQRMITPGATEPTTGWDVLQADGVLQFLPWRDLVFESWRKFEAPILNPYQLAGQPLTANSQSGGFYPLHILFAFLPFTTGLKIILLAILHGFIGAMGVRALLKNLEVSESASLLGGAAFAMSQFMVAWSPLASVTTTVAWIPWLLFGITASTKREAFYGCAFGLSMMLLGGHLQFAAYGVMAVVVTLIYRACGKERAMLVPAIVGLVVGGAIAFPQVSLVLKNSETSHRKNSPTEDGYGSYQKGALAAFEGLSLIHPKLLGDTQLKSNELAENKVPNGYWPMYVKVGSNPAECALWLSPAVLSLIFFAFAGAAERKKAILGTSLVLLGGLLAFGSPLNHLLYFYAPGWSATGSPGRAIVLVVIGLVILAGIGLDNLLNSNAAPKKKMAVAAIPLVLLAIGMNGQRMATSSVSQPDAETLSKIASMATQPAMPIIALCALLSAVALLAMASGKLKPEWSFAPAALAMLPMLTLSPVNGPELKMPTEKYEAQERYTFPSKSWSMVATPNASMPPNTASLARIHDLFGYDSLLDGAFVNKIKAKLGSEPSPPENGNMLLLRRDEALDLGELGVQGVYRKDNPRIKGGSIEYDGYDHQIIRPEPGATEVLVRDRYFPGMRAQEPAKLSSEDGWRKLAVNGAKGDITIHYPGRLNAVAVIIGCILLCVSFVLSRSKQ